MVTSSYAETAILQALSIPFSNAWPEHGGSALKRIKTRLRSRLQNDMLQALMQVSINGPPLHSDQCTELVCDSAQLWLKQKKRRTLPKKGASTAHRGSVCEHVEVADVGVQVETVEADQDHARPNEIRLEDDVEAAAE